MEREDDLPAKSPKALCRLERSSDSHISYGAERPGIYSESSLANIFVVRSCESLVIEALKTIPVKSGNVFTIAEYGCADGGVSLPLMYACVKELKRKHGPEFQIQVTYEDQPMNDFQSLFLRLQGLIPGPRSFYLDFPNVFVTVCGTSFFKQCLPSGSVMLSFSSMAMHWLSTKPCHITGGVFQSAITVREELEKYRKQAKEDWETVLQHRATELTKGAKMVIVCLAELNEEERAKGNSEGKFVFTPDMMGELWQGMADDRIITQEECNQTTFAAYFRSVEEFKKPFESKDSSVRRAGLTLVSMETKVMRYHYDQWKGETGGNATEYAQWYIRNIRLWSNSTFVAGLSGTRSDEENMKIVDELFSRYQSIVMRRPGNHGVDNNYVFILIEKK